MGLISSEVIRRYKNPSKKGNCDDTGLHIARAAGDNALCGDSVCMEFAVEGEGADARIVQARFEGNGCSLCIAAADALAEASEGATVQSVLALDFDGVCEALGGIQVSRSRRECVELPIRALRSALDR